MKIILILAMCYFNLVQIIDSRKFRTYLRDEILTYALDNSVAPFSEIFSTENLIIEQIDDDNVLLSGSMKCLKSLNRNLPLRLNLRSQYLDQATWREGPLQLTILSMCEEFQNPDRYWYNITKLWTSDVCPPQMGDIWRLEEQYMKTIHNLPPSIPMAPWRSYYLLSQGMPGFETIKFGIGLQYEFQPI